MRRSRGRNARVSALGPARCRARRRAHANGAGERAQTARARRAAA
ncbi:hypothetical protein BURPS668_A2532 [Burkholderia pseudomallei 668]|nr:hypothetical protein BURPS668_A2532 [Burkholderia pseudomallei 668]